jgi:signal transduction histidine kinase
MFARTRVRLTALNAAVFLVVLVAIGAAVYALLRAQIYERLDAALVAAAQRYAPTDEPSRRYEQQKGTPAGAGEAEATGRPVLERGVVVLLWDGQGVPYPASLADAGHESFYAQFGAYRSAERPVTVKIDGHYYRTCFLALPSPLLLHRSFMPPGGADAGGEASGGAEPVSPIPITHVQAIVNMDAEQDMLNKLADWFLVGLGVGGALTVLAGLYLANQALRPIRRSWEQQRRFTADASHELRMPLSIIQANAELMLMHPDRSALENSEQISMVLSEVRRMAKLTDQLLLLARSDSGREELLLGPVQLEALIRHVIQLFAPLAELNGVRLDAELASGVELTGDRDKLQQLLVILLDNSLKHTPAGGSIRVVLTRRGQQAAIVVEDTGEGIAEEDLPHIFERFYRGDRARSRGDGGTGLGLAIARWIAEKHGGTIAAASRPGRGTTMTVRLPVAPAGKRIGRFR